MRLASTLALTLCLIPLVGCSQKRVADRHVHPSSSLIEGFGVAGTYAEASKLAWDDAMLRANQLGFAKVSVRLISRSSDRVTYKGNPNARAASVYIEVTPYRPFLKESLPPAADTVGDEFAGHGG